MAVTLAPLLHEGIRRVYPATALLFAEGDPPGPTLVVVAGTVRISTESGGEIAVVGPGELVGEFSAVDGLPRSASVTAVTQVEVRAIAPVRFAELLEANPEIDRYVRRLLDERRHVSVHRAGPGRPGRARRSSGAMDPRSRRRSRRRLVGSVARRHGRGAGRESGVVVPSDRSLGSVAAPSTSTVAGC